ncbi:MAG TPA: GNAT family N-acetyltransferase [Jatrophihabitantaceae bacterium]|nr:GNAT family N-acetyltransferase [Jatrophihabitantaceae bacterium]
MDECSAYVTDDVHRARDDTESFLLREPVHHNLILTLLEQRKWLPDPGRYGVVRRNGEVLGASFQSPLQFHAAITPMPPAAVDALVDALIEVAPDLPGVAGDAATAARFAGRWAELGKVPAEPGEGQRLYELRSLRAPDLSGSLRVAEPGDLDLVSTWAAAFERDTGSAVPTNAVLGLRIEQKLIWLWDDGGPVSMAGYTSPLAGVSRVGHVYTPPEHRGHGYAAACTAGVSHVAFDHGADRCCLYTQLSNPTSNAIYRRLGYEAVAEHLRYVFTPR